MARQPFVIALCHKDPFNSNLKFSFYFAYNYCTHYPPIRISPFTLINVATALPIQQNRRAWSGSLAEVGKHDPGTNETPALARLAFAEGFLRCACQSCRIGENCAHAFSLFHPFVVMAGW